MKISKHRLAQIIREEKRKLLYEVDSEAEFEEEVGVDEKGEDEDKSEEEEVAKARMGLANQIRDAIKDSNGLLSSEFELFAQAVKTLLIGFEQKNLGSKDPDKLGAGFDRLWKTMGIAGMDTSAAMPTEKSESKKLAKRLLRNRKRRR